MAGKDVEKEEHGKNIGRVGVEMEGGEEEEVKGGESEGVEEREGEGGKEIWRGGTKGEEK